MSAEQWAGLISVVVAVAGTLGTGLGWFLKWYSEYRKTDKEQSHKQRMETEAAEHAREKERSSEYRTIESSLVRQWKEVANRQDKQIHSLVADGEKKQVLLDTLVQREKRCGQAFVQIKEWTRYANERLKALDHGWTMDPPDLDLDDFDSEFHARSSAQDTAVLKAMAEEQSPTPPRGGHEHPGGGR